VIEEAIRAMRHSPRHNYVIPGLTSWLIGQPHPTMGCVRLFTMDRFHEEPIIPHSHRFAFRCRVLAGAVTNRIWIEDEDGDPYLCSEVTYEGELGKHRKFPGEVKRYEPKTIADWSPPCHVLRAAVDLAKPPTRTPTRAWQ
jgi:hypothetical protein